MGYFLLQERERWVIIHTNILKGVCDNVYMSCVTSVTPLELSDVYISHVD